MNRAITQVEQQARDQARADIMLCATTGAEFSRHAEALDHLGTALTLVHQFVKLSRD